MLPVSGRRWQGLKQSNRRAVGGFVALALVTGFDVLSNCKRLNGLWAQHLEKCWGKTQVGLTWDSRHEGLGGEMEMCKQQGKQVRRGEGKQAVDSLDSLGKTLEGHSGRVTRVLWMECLLGEKCLFL